MSSIWFVMRYPSGRITGHNTIGTLPRDARPSTDVIRSSGITGWYLMTHLEAPDYEAAKAAAADRFAKHDEEDAT